MVLPLSRELSISYAGFTVGGDQASHVLEGIYLGEQTYEKGTVGFTFVIKQPTAALFAADCAAAEAAFRTPRQDLLIMLGTSTFKSYSHSGSTGFNAFPTITKVQDDLSSGRARRYSVRIEFGLPADNVGTSYRRYSYVNVAYSPSRRRTLTINGTYTAGGGTARANYESAFAAYASSVQTALGGSNAWKILEEPQSTADDQNKEINFSATYEEILFTGIGSADADLRAEKFTVTRSKFAPGDTPANGATVLRLATITATYEAWFNKAAVSTSQLPGKWDTYRTKAITYMQNLFAGGAFALTEEAPDFDPVNNKITARLTATGASSIGVVQFSATTSVIDTEGIQLVPVQNGKKLAKYKYQGPGSLVVTRTLHYELVGTSEVPEGGIIVAPGGGLDMVTMVTQDDKTPIRRGIEPYTMDGIQGTKTTRYEIYEPVLAGGDGTSTPPSLGGGGGGSNDVIDMGAQGNPNGGLSGKPGFGSNPK